MRIFAFAMLVALGSGTLAGQASDPANLVKQGRELTAQGKHEEAARLYRQAIQQAPKSFDARLALGVVLDLQGQYAEARTHLNEAVKLADATAARNQAMNTLAISYAFESKAADAVKYVEPVFKQQVTAKDFSAAAGTANFVGRLFLESGDFANARRWYDAGHEQAKQIPDLPQPERDLWELRWLHAQARLAAREGKIDDTRRHVAAFEQVMNRRGRQADDNEIYRYLLGYVAYYTKDYDRAVAELAKGNLGDPFIAILLAMSYDAKGDAANAQLYYRRTVESNGHTLNNAFARPIARARLR